MACSAYPVHPNGPRGRIDRGTCKEDLADASIRWHRGGGGGHRRVWRDGGRAEPKASNENPPITDAEATCSGTATVTFTGTSAKFDVSITGCPASTVINIGHIHEGAAGVNGAVKIDSTLKAGDITLTGGAVTFSRTNSAADPALITAVMANPGGYYVN